MGWYDNQPLDKLFTVVKKELAQRQQSIYTGQCAGGVEGEG